MAVKRKRPTTYNYNRRLSDEEAVSDSRLQRAVNGHRITEDIGIYPYLRMTRRTPNDIMDSNGYIDEFKTGVSDVSDKEHINFNTEGLTADKGFVCYNDARDKGRPSLEALMGRWKWGRGSYEKLECMDYQSDFEGYMIGRWSGGHNPIMQKSMLNTSKPDRMDNSNPIFYLYRIEDMIFTTASCIPMASFENLLLEYNDMSLPCNEVLFETMTHLMLSLNPLGHYLENGQISRFSYAVTAKEDKSFKDIVCLDSLISGFDLPQCYFPFYNAQSGSETFHIILVNIPSIDVIYDRPIFNVKRALVNLVKQQLIPLGRLYFLDDSEKLILVPVSKEEHFAYAIADYGNAANALDSSLKTDALAVMPKEVFKDMTLGFSESILLDYSSAKSKISTILMDNLKNINKDELYVEILSQILKFTELIVKQVESLDCSVAEALVSKIICKEAITKKSGYICPSRIVTNKIFKL